LAVFEAQHFGKIIHRWEDANHDPFQELAPVSLLKFSYENYDQIIEEDKFLVSVKRLTEVSIILRPLLPMPSCRRPSFTTHQMIHMKQNTISQDRGGIRIVNTCAKPTKEETSFLRTVVKSLALKIRGKASHKTVVHYIDDEQF
jgi:hypothetical protein